MSFYFRWVEITKDRCLEPLKTFSGDVWGFFHTDPHQVSGCLGIGKPYQWPSVPKGGLRRLRGSFCRARTAAVEGGEIGCGFHRSGLGQLWSIFKSLGYLLYIRDNTTQLYWDYNKPL